MALAALLSLLGVESEGDGVELVRSHQQFIADVRASTGAKDAQSALSAVTAQGALARSVMSELGVSTQEEVAPAIQRLREAAGSATQLATQLRDVQAKQAATEKEQLIGQLSTEGKLPPALHAWARTQSKEQLEAWAKDAPVYQIGQPTGGAQASSIVTPAAAPGAFNPEAIQLDDEDRKVCKLTGTDEAAYLDRKRFDASLRAKGENPNLTNPAKGA